MGRTTHYIKLALALAFFALPAAGQNVTQVKRSLTNYFADYTNDAYSSLDKIKVEDIRVDREHRAMDIYLNEPFLGQPFTPETVENVYRNTAEQLPSPYNRYKLTIYVKNKPIEQLVPITLMDKPGEQRLYRWREVEGEPWVTPLSRPNRISAGLQGRHLCLWSSHGIYFSHKKGEWIWQRPSIYCTCEDIFTQTIVLPYLIPMLENAGAVVFTPRERDWQKNEIIIDNDRPNAGGIYSENEGRNPWQSAQDGFAYLRPYYTEGQNPFRDGTARWTETTRSDDSMSSIVWMPKIESSGDYAVYVSYKTVENSVDDALYRVTHGGITSEFRVNQTMGGGTWVYLGTFHFDEGMSAENCVMLSNQSRKKGIVTADAVRFGGGMGNIMRYDSATPDQMSLSRMPRFIECSRYYAQWAGMPYQVYSAKESTDDYGDDINARPRMLNFLTRGSAYYPPDETYVPGDSGLAVPIELSMGVHSDAGLRKDDTLIGTLGIYTTGFYDDITATGLSRLTSRDMADIVMTNVVRDMRQYLGRWNRRAMYDRNYGETREPQVPSMILEMFSHQNWADMRYGHDPYFKFLMARAIYKGILEYISAVHNLSKTVIQPLPVENLAAEVSPDGTSVRLSWQPQLDATSPSAVPERYIIYKKEGNADYDNGTLINKDNTDCYIPIQPGVLYRFRVAAVNDGGSSLKSDEVCAYYAGANAERLFLVDGFQRMAGPQPIDTETLNGFDMQSEPGVVDYRMPGYCGYQLNFSKDGYGKEGPTGLGFSGSELEGVVLAGNTHDYVSRHAADILAGGLYTMSSCTRNALGRVSLAGYRVMDLILGAQKDDGYSMRRYKTFTPELQQTLLAFTQGGGSVLVSGAFVGSDMQSATEQQFTSQVLKYRYQGAMSTDNLNRVQGMNTSASIYNQPNESNYWIRQADVLEAVGGAFSAMLYEQANTSAATAYQGTDYRVMAYGFPLECVQDTETRRAILSASVRFLLNK